MKEYKLNQPKYNKIANQENALKLIGGTSLKDRLIGWNYKQLTIVFGEPTFGKVSSDGKIQKQWVFIRTADNEVFTIYDWKTYDERYTLEEYDRWHVGGKVYSGDFEDLIEQLVKKKIHA